MITIHAVIVVNRWSLEISAEVVHVGALVKDVASVRLESCVLKVRRSAKIEARHGEFATSNCAETRGKTWSEGGSAGGGGNRDCSHTTLLET